MKKQYVYFEFETENGNKVRFFEDQYGFGGLSVNNVEYADREFHFAFDENKTSGIIYFSKSGEPRKAVEIPEKTLNEIISFEKE